MFQPSKRIYYLFRNLPKDTNTYFKFYLSYFIVKDDTTTRTLLYGQSNNNLYVFPFSSSVNKKFHPTTFTNEHAPIHHWHSHLGHTTLHVVSCILFNHGLPIFCNKGASTCFTCHTSKSKQLSFARSSSHVTCPIDLVYTDHRCMGTFSYLFTLWL